MNKKELREIYKIIRRNIKDKRKKDQEIFETLLKDENLQNSSIVLIYVSTKDEVDTLNMIKELLSTKIVAVPKVEDNIINFYCITSLGDLKLGKFNILEPITSEKVNDFSKSICIVPGICFDKSNNRLGYGGGYYDKFLTTYPGYSIGLCYVECLLEHLETEVHDIKVKKIICK